MLTLMEDANVGTDLVIHPGQNVIITGDAGLVEAPSWGSGGFTVEEMGSLALSRLRLDGPLSVVGAGSLVLRGCELVATVSRRWGNIVVSLSRSTAILVLVSVLILVSSVWL
eukprot:SAG31_NODE_3141_length_4629_cov_2.158057_2_plen_112_part_00